MNFSLGVFEVYGDALPGGLTLGVLYYVFWRNGLLDLGSEATGSSIALLLIAFVLSLLVGQVLAPISYLLERAMWWNRRHPKPIAIEEFRARNGHVGERKFVDADQALLRAAVQMTNLDAASEISSIQAQSKMLRNVTVPLSIAMIVAVFEVFLSGAPWVAVGAFLVFGALMTLAFREGHRKARWSFLKTLELAAWIPDLDARLEPSALPAETQQDEQSE